MLPFGVTIPASVPQRSEIPEGLMNYSVYIDVLYAWYRDVTKYVKNVLSYRLSGGPLTNYLFAMQINIA
jgi:hypothetical protein